MPKKTAKEDTLSASSLGKWITETADDTYQVINSDFVYRNESVNRFLNNETKYFIITTQNYFNKKL